jgi:hypothetical protein
MTLRIFAALHSMGLPDPTMRLAHTSHFALMPNTEGTMSILRYVSAALANGTKNDIT